MSLLIYLVILLLSLFSMGAILRTRFLCSIQPTSGPAGSQTTVTLRGRFLVPNSKVLTVNFGSHSINVQLPAEGAINEFRVHTPPLSAGSVTVTVSDYNGSAQYIFFDPVVLTSISPTTGSYLGGTPITITGSGFVDVEKVTFTYEDTANKFFIDVPASQFNVIDNNTKITLSTPPNPGYLSESGSDIRTTTQVTVTTKAAGTTTASLQYTYVKPTTSEPGL